MERKTFDSKKIGRCSAVFVESSNVVLLHWGLKRVQLWDAEPSLRVCSLAVRRFCQNLEASQELNYLRWPRTKIAGLFLLCNKKKWQVLPEPTDSMVVVWVGGGRFLW